MNFAKPARRSGAKICSINYCFHMEYIKQGRSKRFSALLRRPSCPPGGGGAGALQRRLYGGVWPQDRKTDPSAD